MSWGTNLYVVDFSDNGWGGPVQHVGDTFVYYAPFEAELDEVRVARIGPGLTVFYTKKETAREALQKRYDEADRRKRVSGPHGDAPYRSV